MIGLLSRDHLKAFLDSQTWHDNPFVIRESRRDRKRKQATRSYFWMALVMVCCIALAAAGIVAALNSGSRFPWWWIGGDPFVALTIVVSGTHVMFIAGASQRTTAQMLRQEAFKNTLMHLILLPMSPFQVVLEAAIYAWMEGMRVAITLLPFYVFMAAMDKISWLDLLMLYGVFATVSFAAPITRRPMLADDVTTASIPQPLARRPGSTALAQTARGQQQNQNANSSLGMVMACLLPMFFAFFVMVGRLGGRGGSRTLQSFHQYIPDSLLTLMPTSLLSWPLLIARGVITPLDWFGHRIPPIVFCLVLTVVTRYVQMVRTSEYLQVGLYRDLAFLPTYLPRRRLETVVRYIQLFVVTGYLWRWGIVNGGLNFLSNGAIGRGSGLPGFAYALLCMLGWVVMTRVSLLANWRWSERSKRRLLAVRHYPSFRALRYALEPFVFVIGYYLACCLLSGTAPLPPGVHAIAAPMLALCAVGGLLSYGVDSLFWQAGTLIKLAVPILYFIGFGYYHSAAARPLLTLSPTLGFLSLLHPLPYGLAIPGNLLTGFGWQDWVIRGGAVGGLLTLLGTLLFALRKPHPGSEGVALDPTLYGQDVFTDPPLPRQETKRVQEETAFCRKIVDFTQRIADNAIATKELRVRLRSALEGTTLPYLVVALLMLHIGVYLFIPEVPRVLGGEFASYLFGHAHSEGVQTIAAMLICWLVALLALACFSGFATARAFAIERDKSTLGFILLTPLSESSIVLGKASGILLSVGLIQLFIAIWTLAMALLLTPFLGLSVLLGWLLIVGTAAAVYLAVGMTTLAVATFLLRWKVHPGCWVGLIFVFQMSLSAIVPLGNMVGDYVRTLGLTGAQIWGALFVLCLLMIVVSYLVAVLGVRWLRTKDLTFVGAKTEN